MREQQAVHRLVGNSEEGVSDFSVDPLPLGKNNLFEEFSGVVTWNDRGLVARFHALDKQYLWTSTTPSALVITADLHSEDTSRTLQACVDRAGRDLEAALRNLTGNFALALCQSTDDCVVLSTDHFGIRPIFYRHDENRLIFGTRLESLRVFSEDPFAIDLQSVYHYLNFTYVPGPRTIYKNTFLLPPGTALIVRKNTLRLSSYWRMNYPGDAVASEEELAFRLRHSIDLAVRRTLCPTEKKGTIGTFLSGGTDSGTISGIVAREIVPLRAYSIAFGEDDYNELHYAKLLAQRFGLEHHVHQLTADELLQSIPLLLQECDQPFGNPSIVATWRCAKLASEHDTTVLLAGDGGDEIFGGNERYAKDSIYGLYYRLPAWLRCMLSTLAQALPEQSLWGNRVRNFTYRGNMPNPERFYADDAFASKWWDSLVLPQLAGRVQRDSSVDVVRQHFQQTQASHELDRLMYVDLQMAIWGNDLPKVMTAARATGVRVRFPFLDPDLAQCTGALPFWLKVRGVKKRYLFKRAVTDVLPQETLRKTKHGFGVPVAEWIRTDRRVREAVLDPLLDARGFIRTYLSRDGLQRIMNEHLRNEWDHGMWLWALMMLERWMYATQGEQRHA
ncbi:MAG: asparagine synthetase B [Candidatus Binatia bacterium]